MTNQETLHTATGRTLDELDMQAILSGKLTPDDFRISAETLRRQAQAAEQAGYGQLAENFRRAAELTRQLLGFALTGEATKYKMTLQKELPAILA